MSRIYPPVVLLACICTPQLTTPSGPRHKARRKAPSSGIAFITTRDDHGKLESTFTRHSKPSLLFVETTTPPHGIAGDSWQARVSDGALALQGEVFYFLPLVHFGSSEGISIMAYRDKLVAVTKGDSSPAFLRKRGKGWCTHCTQIGGSILECRMICSLAVLQRRSMASGNPRLSGARGVSG